MRLVVAAAWSCTSVLPARALGADADASSETRWAFWTGFPLGVMTPSLSGANRAAEEYGAEFHNPLYGMGVDLGVLWKGVVFSPIITMGGTIGGPLGKYPAQRFNGYETVATERSRELSLNEGQAGMNLGYVVWSDRRMFLYPMIGAHYYVQYLAWKDFDEIMDYQPPENPMSKAGWGGFLGVGAQRTFPITDLGEEGARVFIDLQCGALLHLGGSTSAFHGSQYAPIQSFGSLQTGIVMLNLGIGGSG